MAEIRKDFLLDSNGDFPLEDTISPSGAYLDTPYGESDEQHILDLLKYYFGSMKRFPTDGVGIFLFINGENITQLASKVINQNMERDGYYCAPGTVTPQAGGSFIVQTKFITRK